MAVDWERSLTLKELRRLLPRGWGGVLKKKTLKPGLYVRRRTGSLHRSAASLRVSRSHHIVRVKNATESGLKPLKDN